MLPDHTYVRGREDLGLNCQFRKKSPVDGSAVQQAAMQQCSSAAVQRLQSNHSLLLAAIADIREKLVRPNQRLQGAE